MRDVRSPSGAAWLAATCVLVILAMPAPSSAFLDEAAGVGIEDVLTLLREQPPLEPRFTDAAPARKTPPDTSDRAVLVKFYFQRSQAALMAGFYSSHVSDLMTAAAYADATTSPPLHVIWNERANIERKLGDYASHLESLHKAIAAVPDDDRGWLITLRSKLVMVHASAGDLKAAEAELAICSALFAESLWSSSFSPQPDRVVSRRSNLAIARGALAEALGKYVEAEAEYRYALAVFATDAGLARHPIIDEIQFFIARTLIEQGRLVEAETEARKAVLGAVLKHGRVSIHTAWVLRGLVWALLEQKRYRDAERISREAVAIYAAARGPSDAPLVAVAHAHLAMALQYQGRDHEALLGYELAHRALGSDPAFMEQLLGDVRGYADVLVRTGRLDRALEVVGAALDKRRRAVGEDHVRTAEMRAYLGRIYAAKGDLRRALVEFRAATPHLLTGFSGGDDGTPDGEADARLSGVLSAYVGVLAEIRGTALEQEAGIDAVEEAFQVADVARWRSVQRALNASAVRAAAGTRVLADLVRRQQDARWEIAALHRRLGALVSAPIVGQEPTAIENVRGRIDDSRRALDAMAARIEQEFPEYWQLTNPTALSVAHARTLLGPDEALVATLVLRERTYVWAVAQRGPVAFAVVPLDARRIRSDVATLRTALDVAASTLHEIPEFDVALAHRLYTALLEPVRAGWQNARSLLIVADGPLGRLPFALLPVKSVGVSRDATVAFTNYRDVPWLVRTHAVSMVPSVASLKIFRGLPAADPHRQPFVGFGDPAFDGAHATSSGQAQTDGDSISLGTRGVPVAFRRRPQGFDPAQLRGLPALPETAHEIRSLALAMNADPTRDVFLGPRATEATVKALDLARYRVIAFATHGLVPGDLAGLKQPALALSMPDSADGDGLLTMDEILGLRLNADWVVLSACNTASGHDVESELASGLGQAFLYAGARALLVSSWPVETTSALALTTELFRRQETSGVSRAHALQQTMNWLIDHGHFADAASGAVVFSYAHPIFWAPFTIIGDGRSASVAR